MKEKRKSSWIPVIAAFVIPLLVLVALYYAQVKHGTAPTPNDTTPINLVVRVMNKKGDMLVDKEVFIARDDEKGVPSSNPMTTKTDSAGMATATIIGADNYIIRIGHAVFRERIMPVKPGAPVELTFTVDQ